VDGVRLHQVRIVADARPHVGVGHLQRCLSIARSMPSQGTLPVELVLLGPVGGVAAHRLEPLQTRIIDADEVLQKPEILAAGQNEDCLLVLDSYLFNDAASFARIRDAAGTAPVLTFDDSNAGSHWPVLGLVRPGIGAKSYDLDGGMARFSAVGPDYFPLRPEVALASRPPRRRTDPDTPAILVTLGGADPEHYTEALMHALSRLDFPARFDVVFGAGTQSLRSETAPPDGRFSLHHCPANFIDLMGSSDLAVTAGGNTCHELLYLGTPVAAVALAENQLETCRALVERECGAFVGMMGDMPADEMADRIAALLSDRDRLAGASSTGRALIDGKGAARLAGFISRVDDAFFSDRFLPEDVAREYDESAHEAEEYAKARWGSDASMRNRMHLACARIDWNHVDSWLDIGAGSGLLLAAGEQYGRPARFLGIDLSSKIIEVARARTYRTARVEFLAADFLSAIPGAPYSLVTALGVLQKCGASLEFAMSRIAELLRTNGQAFITTKNRAWRRFGDEGITPFEGHHWFDPDRLLHACRHAGLRIVEIGSFDPANSTVSSDVRDHHSLFVHARKER
jgi:spore coat polysaccharide biosynthesis predicted glycosyltransferase SpsG/cyclopropane fatty-acyl-phospholipid synthase-like methyltransferase